MCDDDVVGVLVYVVVIDGCWWCYCVCGVCVSVGDDVCGVLLDERCVVLLLLRLLYIVLCCMCVIV